MTEDLVYKHLEWKEYPVGTKAHAYNGGAWVKQDDGRWLWNGHTRSPGGSFPRPGPDAFGRCVELPAGWYEGRQP